MASWGFKLCQKDEKLILSFVKSKEYLSIPLVRESTKNFYIYSEVSKGVLLNNIFILVRIWSWRYKNWTSWIIFKRHTSIMSTNLSSSDLNSYTEFRWDSFIFWIPSSVGDAEVFKTLISRKVSYPVAKVESNTRRKNYPAEDLKYYLSQLKLP